MPDLSALIDMNYFWWVFGTIVGFGIIFLVIYLAIGAAGWVLETIIAAFKKMRS